MLILKFHIKPLSANFTLKQFVGECVWPFCGTGALRIKILWIFGQVISKQNLFFFFSPMVQTLILLANVICCFKTFSISRKTSQSTILDSHSTISLFLSKCFLGYWKSNLLQLHYLLSFHRENENGRCIFQWKIGRRSVFSLLAPTKVL